jgi:DNA mismatch repair protein MutH
LFGGGDAGDETDSCILWFISHETTPPPEETLSTSNLPYGPGKIDSIVECAGSLVGHTLREKTNAPELQSPKQRRGSFGNALEEYFFDYKLNSNSMPDFPKVGLELKSTPVKRTAKGELVAKERLVLM